jgi:hypothetical protein
MRGTFSKRSLRGACGLLTCLILTACEQELIINQAAPPLELQAPPLAQQPEAGKPAGPKQPSSGAPESTGQTWYVSPRGSHSGRGTLESPLRTISKALEKAAPGDTILVLPGTYSEQLYLENHGSSAAPITLRGEGSPQPTIVPEEHPERSAVMLVRGAYNIENLRIDLGGLRMSAIVFERTASRSRVSGCELRSGSSGAGVLVAGANHITIEDNHIHHFIKSGDDSHGVLVVGPSRNITVRDNDIHHNSGDSVQCQSQGNQPAEDVLIESNKLSNEGENAVDIKLCNRVTVRNNEMFGFPNTAVRPRGSSAAEAVIIHDSARNVTIQENIISKAGRGVSVVTGSGRPPENVRIEGNTITEIRNMPVGNGQGIRVGSGRNVQVLDNVIENTASYRLMLAADDGVVYGLVVKKNTLRGGDQAPLLRLGDEFARPQISMSQNYYSRGGVLKGDGLRDRLGGVLGPFRSKFIGDQLVLTDPDKLDAWRHVLGLDYGSGIVD